MVDSARLSLPPSPAGRRRVLIGRACSALTIAIVVGAIVQSARSANLSAFSGHSVRTCATSALKTRLVNTGGAGGTAGGYIGFTNQAHVPCRLTGWPTLVAVSATGASTTAVRTRSTMFGPRPNMKGVPVVTFRHGERADAVFAVGGNGIGNTCPPPYRHLRVTPPGNSRSVLLSAWLPGLDAFLPACTQIEVTMIVRRRPCTTASGARGRPHLRSRENRSSDRCGARRTRT